ALPISSLTSREDHQTVVIFRMGADKFSTMLPAISLVFVLIGLISIFMTIYRLVLGDSRSIGVLLSIGLERRSIASAYLALGGVILFVGALMGVLLGYAFTAGVSQMALDMMGGIPVVLPSDPMPTLTALTFTALAVMAATAIPVAVVVRKSVNEALSYVPHTKVRTFGRHGRSLAVSLGLRNLFREPTRAAVVLVAVSLSIGTAGSWVLMVDSAMTYLDDQMEVQRWDVSIAFNALLDRESAVENLTTAEVAAVLPYATLTGTLSSEGGTSGAAMLASLDMAEVRNFDFQEGSFQSGGAILSKKLARDLDAHPGDAVTFTLGGKEVDLVVAGTINDMQSNAVYTDSAQIMDLIGEGKCQGAFVILNDPGSAPAFAEKVSEGPLVAAVELGQEQASDLRTLFESSISMLYGFFALNLLIALAMAVLATVISTSERDMEFAALASLGVPRSFVWRSLAAEVMTQASIAALLAVPFAYLLAKQFALLMEEAVFLIPIVLSISAIVSVAFLGWLFIWPSVLWPIRWVKKLDLVRTLRDRSGR
ncbi:MAG TPA: FtsX-like permease family protein, partial [Methanomassiliicoccales archaeon]|nr:FtsX-like permease family protein [Methanomassiliicoccales archaeon]